MKNDFETFKLALIKNDKELFKKIAKGDLHNHALLGSNRKQFNKKYPNKNLEHFEFESDISSLSRYIKNNIIDISTTSLGQLTLFECTILSALEDGITILEMSVDYRLVFEAYNNNFKKYVDDLMTLKNKYKTKIQLSYDLGISNNAYNVEHEIIILKLIDSGIFGCIDIYGDETAKPFKVFKNIYKYAKKKNMKLKAHVGEFGSAKDIYKAIRVLHLDVVQHGINIVNSKKIMKYAKKKNIQFNICPISNIKLNRIESVKNHPIKTMYDFGLKVTINTDDQLIFENSLFDEYNLLYKEKVFTIEQLNEIRLNSIR